MRIFLRHRVTETPSHQVSRRVARTCDFGSEEFGNDCRDASMLP